MYVFQSAESRYRWTYFNRGTLCPTFSPIKYAVYVAECSAQGEDRQEVTSDVNNEIDGDIFRERSEDPTDFLDELEIVVIG